MKNNPFIKKNNDQIRLEKFNKKTMRYCANENKEMNDENCLGCIFLDEEEKKCLYKDWFPGLRKGREWK